MENSRGFSMAAAIGLRSDFTGEDFRRLALSSRDAKQVRRLLALAVIRDGGSRTEAARVGGVGLQILRGEEGQETVQWTVSPTNVVRFNAEGPDGLIDRKAPGKPPTLTPAQRAALAAAVEAGPEPWRDGVVRWRLIDLVQWLWDAFRVSVSAATVGRELRALGFRKLSARPRHYAQDPEAAEAFKKVSRSAWARSGTPGRASTSSSGSRMKQGSGRRTG
jgi:transposase